MEKQRLDKIIASTGKFSRREVKTLVRQGKVLVDGIPARSGEDKVDAEAVEIVGTFRKGGKAYIRNTNGLRGTEKGQKDLFRV